MSRHLTIAAFSATVLVAVPAGWHMLDADIQTDGPATRPKQQVLHTGGAAISMELDRGVLLAGNQLKVTLVATSETPKRIALTVRALEDNGIGGERVPNPPTVVSRRKVIIDAAPGGGKPLELAFDLRAPHKKGRVQWYDVDVTPTGKTGDSLVYYDTEDDAGTVVPANAAKAGAAMWGGNSFGLAIEPPAQIPPEGPFTVSVRMTNTTKKPIDYADITLGGPELAYSGMEGLTTRYQGEDGDFDVKMQDETDEPPVIEPGKERIVKFDVTPTHPGVKAFTLIAQANANTAAALQVATVVRPSVDEATQTAVAANTK